MICKIIEEINKSLENETYLSALSLALTLPDICAKAEFGDVGNKKRYIDWWDKYISPYEQVEEFPYLSGEVIYELRCNYLHQGSIDVNKEKIKDNVCKIDDLILIVSDRNSFGIYFDLSTDRDFDGRKKYYLDINRLCYLITVNAKKCFEDNPERYSFLKRNIYDIRKTRTDANV